MSRKIAFLLAGFFFTGIVAAQAQNLPQTPAGSTAAPVATQQAPTIAQTQQQPDTDSFNFVIANPNTVDPKRFIFEIKPGASATDSVILKNSAEVPLHFSLYGADATQTNQGSFALKTKDEPRAEVGKWISFDQGEITLQPGQVQQVGFTVSVPAGTPEGSYSGGLAAEKVSASTSNPNILIAVRIGLRLDVKVTSNPQPVTKKYTSVTDNPFFKVYFWASIGLFLVFAAMLVWSLFGGNGGGKKPKKHRHGR